MRYTIYYTTLLKKRMASMKCDHSPSIEEVTEYLVKQFGHKERDIAVTRILELTDSGNVVSVADNISANKNLVQTDCERGEQTNRIVS